jgi:anaerobic selenocysteine-containing dehydrogenase
MSSHTLTRRDFLKAASAGAAVAALPRGFRQMSPLIAEYAKLRVQLIEVTEP